MNRDELVDTVLYFDALAAAATGRARAAREELDRQARDEHAKQGTAPTWRASSGTVSLGITKPSYAVDDERAFVAWVALNAPSEVEEITRVRPAYATQFLKTLAGGGDLPVVDDQLVPGLRYVPGGVPRGISILPGAAAKAGAAELAEAALAKLFEGAS